MLDFPDRTNGHSPGMSPDRKAVLSMLPRCLLCSLPVLAFALGASATSQAAGPALESETISSTLVQVREPGETSPALQFEDGTLDQDGSVSWEDLSISESHFPATGVSAAGRFANMELRPSEAPPIIAAPLPPAFVSGLVGLAGVYAYRRRQRVR